MRAHARYLRESVRVCVCGGGPWAGGQRSMSQRGQRANPNHLNKRNNDFRAYKMPRQDCIDHAQSGVEGR